jgi:hypothetical protein
VGPWKEALVEELYEGCWEKQRGIARQALGWIEQDAARAAAAAAGGGGGGAAAAAEGNSV